MGCTDLPEKRKKNQRICGTYAPLLKSVLIKTQFFMSQLVVMHQLISGGHTSLAFLGQMLLFVYHKFETPAVHLFKLMRNKVNKS